MSLDEWIDLAATLAIDGLEFYAGFLDLADERNWPRARQRAQERGLAIPMLCCSPDFTHPDAAFRRQQIEQEKRWIDMAAALGFGFCRVLSGQRRPEVAAKRGSTMPPSASRLACRVPSRRRDAGDREPLQGQLLAVSRVRPAHGRVLRTGRPRIDSPHFGVNYDPSNTLPGRRGSAGAARRVKHRVVTMHASDRYLAEGTLEDLRREEGSSAMPEATYGTASSAGLNDYDAIFRELRSSAFDGWISIEDGVDGIDELAASVTFLRRKIAPATKAKDRETTTAGNRSSVPTNQPSTTPPARTYRPRCR
jgi:sugar phosphate isomerase/epimerase